VGHGPFWARPALHDGGVEGLDGRLLVATPLLGDPNFERTVVLLLAHGGEGTVGLVLNRPSTTDVADPLPRWAALAAPPPVVFVGGPVAQRAAICLAAAGPPDAPEGWRALAGTVGTLDLGGDPAQAEGVVGLRIFVGHAGWGGGQLEAEIAEGSWFVVDADPGDALTPEPAELWTEVLRRQPPALARFAHFPADPTMN
jgi:putative transcriptional regulator